MRNSVEIIPGVSGSVIDVPIEPNRPIKAGEVLFKIDPVAYQAALDQYSAQLQRDQALLAKDQTNLQRYQQLVAQNSIARQQEEDQKYIVDQDQANIRLDHALIDGATHNLDNTVVTAPTDGYVTNLALRKGARVNGQSPVMAFIDTADTIFGAEIPQIYARYIAVGQLAEVTFKFFPGVVYTARVEAVLQAIATGQPQVGDLAVAPTRVQAAPFVVRFKLDDQEAAQRLPTGSTGLAAIYTDQVKASHVIRQVVLRQTAILNYVNPF